MLYRILKPFFVDATRRFFRDIHLRGTPVEEAPLLIAANHSSVVLDGLLIVSAYRRRLWFIVKGTIFRGAWINWLLHWLHLTPVYRRRDDPNQMSKNEAAFDAVIERLLKGDAVLVFPEGASVPEWHLEKFKTGTARIALEADHRKEGASGLRIQPVGITYSDFFRFNSSATVYAGEPIDVSRYTESFVSNPEAAVKDLTEAIHEQIHDLTVDLSDLSNINLIEKLDKLYQSRGMDEDDQRRLIMVTRRIEEVQEKTPKQLHALEKRLSRHLELSESLKLDGSEKPETTQNRFFMALCSPFILLGIITLFIPYRLSWWISRKLAAHSAQYSSYALSAAFILFPLWDLGLGILVWGLTGKLGAGIATIILVVGAGYFTSKYFNRFAIYVFRMLWPGRKSPIDVLALMRDDLIADFESLAPSLSE